ncbi:hypothetical protein AC792_09760 [Arthrobacter sp. RIT-PI-e]|uniref:DUF7793 family protein n=1 Tax=Arthrobacter sp. RIT-PI-e TaxID=1681197 RepID=UPI0006768D2E|nr:STAS/SEC14 domain-containing protein [Arthrobacter sp. RIT-PI-e]KNC18862.1 hypothetical protein AC792_09760 [Arthrobacter sp. RIT-PI-e]
MVSGDTARFVLTVGPDFNRLRWAPGVTMFGRDVRATISAVDAVSTAAKRPLLVDIGSIERITPSARQLLIDDTCSTRTAVLSTDVVTKVITAFAYTSATPTRFFTDESEAIRWLLKPSAASGNRHQSDDLLEADAPVHTGTNLTGESLGHQGMDA